MYMDFRRDVLAAHQSSVFKGQAVDIVTGYKYLPHVWPEIEFWPQYYVLCNKGQQHGSV